MKLIDIRGRKIGPGFPCFVVAEAGVNHNGKLESAFQLVDIAKKAGADAVKFQTFISDRLATPDAPKAEYQRGPEESQLQMIRNLELSFESFEKIRTYCEEAQILFMSTPFDEQSVDFLDALGVAAFKVASGEITNHSLLFHIAKKFKPIVLSTGMCYLHEVEEAVRVVKKSGNDQLVLLHCVSNYPTNPADVNLRAMQTLMAAFDVPVGFSDHTLGTEVAIAAVGLGACLIEKHFTIDRNLPGPDHQMSLQPDELATLVRSIRLVEQALGTGVKEPAPSEFSNRIVARRCIVAACSIAPGTIITREMLTLKRAGEGLSPGWMEHVIGRVAGIEIHKDQIITQEMVL